MSSQMVFYAPEFNAVGRSYEQLINRRKSIEASELPDVEKFKIICQIDLEIDDMAHSLEQISNAIDDMLAMETVGGSH